LTIPRKTIQFRLRYRCWIGSCGLHDMSEVTSDHDASEHDPERQWARGRIFRCTTCEDEIRVVLPDPSPVEGAHPGL